MEILGRDAWGARAASWAPGVVKQSQGVFIHYNGPGVSQGVLDGNQDAVAAFLRATQNYHMDSNGWPDIAYSFCVDSTGRIWTLRGWGIAGAHTLNWNWDSHAIFLPLGGDQSPTDVQIAAARWLISQHNERWGAGFVKGHQQAPNQTSCPGPQVMARIAEFNPTATAPTSVPYPPGVDSTVEAFMLRNKTNGTISVFYDNTPFRVDLRSTKDVDIFKTLGVPYRGDADAWFWKVTSPVKTGT